jgi:predicted Zn-dependent peptidase
MQGKLSLTLPNGTCLVLTAMEQVLRRPVVICNLLVGAGAASDPEGKRGLAHVMEHAYYRVPEEVRKLFPEKLGQSFDARGVVYPRARTELDFTRYSMIAPLDLYDEVLSFFASWLETGRSSPTRAAKSIAEVVAEKRDLEAQSAVAGAYDALYEASFPGHPYRGYTVGRFEDLGRMGPEDCLSFQERHYRPENLVFHFLLSGELPQRGLEPLAEAASRALGGGGAWSARVARAPHPQADAPLPAAPRTRLARDPQGRPALVLGFRVPRSLARSPAELRVVSHLLLGPGSRLRQRLGPMLEGLAGFTPLTLHPGLYEVTLLPRADASPERMVELLLEEAELCHSSDEVAAQLERAKASASAEWKAGFAALPQRVEQSALYDFLGLDDETCLGQDRLIGALEAEAVAVAAKGLLASDRCVAIRTF